MSGIEVAGIALAILPLLVATAEHYDDCLLPLARYRKFASEVSRFQDQLKIQKILFRNQCRILLEFVVGRDDVAPILAVPRNSLPSNSDIEIRLAEQLGELKEACTTIISRIDERLLDIEKESQDLEVAVNQDQTVTSLLSKAKVLLANDSNLRFRVKFLETENGDIESKKKFGSASLRIVSNKILLPSSCSMMTSDRSTMTSAL